MKLIEEVKILRNEFPDIKIRQRTDNLNRVCAVFELENCAENIVLHFEHDYIILEFYGSKSVYGYPEKEFRYLISELHSLIDCRLFIMSVENRGVNYGGFMVSVESLNSSTIIETAKRGCRNRLVNELPDKAFVNMYYCNTELDSCEYCDFTKS